MVKKNIIFEANIKWGYSNDDLDLSLLPEEFAKAKILWASKNEKNILKACRLITPFVTCLFIGDNIDGDLSELFYSDLGEIEANQINVYALDFSKSNLPRIKASAVFDKILSSDNFNNNKLEQWQEENGHLDNCISFEWRLENIDDDLDLYSWNHSGLGLKINLTE